MFFHFPLLFRPRFLHRFLHRLLMENDSKNDPFWRSFWWLFGDLFLISRNDRFWDAFWLPLAPFGSLFGSPWLPLGLFWLPFGYLLASFWHPFGSVWRPSRILYVLWPTLSFQLATFWCFWLAFPHFWYYGASFLRISVQILRKWRKTN